MSSVDAGGVVLARLDQLPEGGFLEVEAVLGDGPESLVLYRAAADQVRAWLNVCPHAGRRLDWAPGQFLKSAQGQLICAAHGAAFELDEGVCVGGPCRGDRLRAVAVGLRNDEIVLVG